MSIDSVPRGSCPLFGVAELSPNESSIVADLEKESIIRPFSVPAILAADPCGCMSIDLGDAPTTAPMPMLYGASTSA